MTQSRVIVITGASGGIGAALARQLGARGERLVLAARRPTELGQVAKESHPDALSIVTDVTDRAQVEQLRDQALHRFGQVDVWVNNAGRGIGRKVLELTDDDFDAMMAVNVKSALYGMQAIVPHFKERGSGHLINVSSYLGRVPVITFRSAYNAAKAALNVLTANVRMDLQREYPGIHITLVMPGTTATDFQRSALYGTPSPPKPWGATTFQTAEEVATAMVQVIDHPVAEVYTIPGQRELVLKYFEDVEQFEAGMLKRG